MMFPKTVYLETLGCQMNALDSELVLGALRARGCGLAEDFDAAELVVLNTCSVRRHAEDKVYSRLGQIKSAANRHPDQIVAVIGCMAERDGDGLLQKVPHVDILCGPAELHRLPGLIQDVQENRRPVVALSGRLRDRSTRIRDVGPHEDIESLDAGRAFDLSSHVATPKVFGPHQAYVRITRGCNKHCSFCVVPDVRGRERHRAPGRIVEEVRRLADAGVVEVTLLGQTVNHYCYRGDGSGNETTFAQLLRRVHDEVPQLLRLRFVTSYPRDFSEQALQVMAESPRICRYLHVPAQSGSNKILKRMNRGYTVEAYKALLDRARERMPDICLAGDMIVGFSGETEDDFQQSLDLLRYAKYKNCFVFKYSPRPGTVAEARLPDDVPDEVKRRRNYDMLAVQAEISLAHHKTMLGQIAEILVEGPSKSAAKARARKRRNVETAKQEREKGIDRADASREQLVGRTRGDQIVVFAGTPDMIGRLLRVRITTATPHTLHGEVVEGGDRALPRERDIPLTTLNP